MSWCDLNSVIPCIPDWLLVLLGLLFGFLIYRYLPTDAKKTFRKGLKKYGVYIIILVIWIFWSNKTTLIHESPGKWPATMNRATFFMLFVAFLVFAFKAWLYEFRYYTNHFISDNVQGSCHRYQEVGNVGDSENNWVVFYLGGSGSSDEKFIFPWPWTKKIVVVPKSACQFLGNQIVAYSQVEKVDLYDLPEPVSGHISNDTFGRWCKDNVYLGLWNVETLSKDPKYSAIQSDLKKTNARVNELREMLKGKLSTTKQFISDTLGMSDKFKGKDWRDQNPRREVE